MRVLRFLRPAGRAGRPIPTGGTGTHRDRGTTGRRRHIAERPRVHAPVAKLRADVLEHASRRRIAAAVRRQVGAPALGRLLVYACRYSATPPARRPRCGFTTGSPPAEW